MSVSKSPMPTIVLCFSVLGMCVMMRALMSVMARSNTITPLTKHVIRAVSRPTPLAAIRP